MTNYFSVTLNLAASAHQPEIIQNLKSRGDDCIQTSSGLCVKTTLSEAELKELVGENAGGLTIQKLDSSKRDDLSPDVLAFIGG
jgi:hypothetical protein